MTNTTAAETRHRSPYWSRMLSRESSEEIADRMREVLGENHFTLVTCNSFDENSHRFSAVDVMPSQWLCEPVRLDHEVSAAHIMWSTTRLSMGVSTQAETVSEAHRSGPHDYVRFTFEPGRVVIDHYAPARYRLQWIFAVERHDRDEL